MVRNGPRKRLVVLAVTLASMHATRADTFLNGALRMVSTGDAAALGATVGCRVYQVTGPVTTINANTPTCVNQRCIRTFNTQPIYGGSGFGGYACNFESTGPYGPPVNEPSDQVYYELIDAEVGPGTCDHIGFYAVQGQLANNNTHTNPGDWRGLNCPGTVQTNCFTAADPSNADPTPLTNPAATFGSFPHQIGSSGGLSPVPTVRVSSPGGGGCGPGLVRVSWDDPISADPLMKNGVPSPVQGVNLYRNETSCGLCPTETDVGWARASTLLEPNGEYGPSSGAAGDCVDVGASGSVRFALTIRVKGPGNGPTTLETYLGAHSQCAGATGTAARIVSLSARYAGRGVVTVRWTSGV